MVKVGCVNSVHGQTMWTNMGQNLYDKKGTSNMIKTTCTKNEYECIIQKRKYFVTVL